MSRKRKYNDSMLKIAVKKSISVREVLLSLGLKYGGGSFSQIKKDIKRLRLKTDHFKGQGHGKTKGRLTSRVPINQLLTKKSIMTRGNVKRRLIREELLVEKCSVCGLKNKWNGQKLVMVLDHINGIKDDCRLKNLRLLCPNCNSQTPTFAGRNVKNKARKSICKKCGTKIRKNKTRFCTKCFHDKRREKLLKLIRCKSCGKVITNKSKYTLCINCAQRHRYGDIKRPSNKRLIRETSKNGFLATGRKYGVSDNAIRKWMKLI